ncbi:DUF3883 domain-containing protein [Paractinoplanes atraurantiacus]|uniref:Protein NO VEIN C-terminal domain-containing protein n=1 Tax=Paractinoplanes atraurantiacus TaxID=1036182 RepID=A0A285J0H1_9ACTN|nr:DUF3883 domain-containing protein [Actinoplanes atraurantiacus]SNY53708.1 protein of unknown function [Actinoplanes atraurantiacus]
MALNEWWAGDPAQRYWLEITDRPDLGENLHAPQRDGAGTAKWTYDLVRYVEPGDVVLHWHKTLIGRPALVGFSQAAGAVTASTIVWRARGTSGRAKQTPPRQPSWLTPLRGYTALHQPVDQSVLRQVEDELRDVFEKLSETYPGTLYLPFAFSDKRPIRAAQGYLVKFPAELLKVIPGLDEVPAGPRPGLRAPGDGEKPTKAGSTRTRRSARGAGYISDAKLRRALEEHAVAQATALYQAEGWTVTDVGKTRPYDLLLTRDGDPEERHVEVKGTTQTATEVELTSGEVDHSREPAPCDLFVVSEINYIPDGLGGYITSDGIRHLWRDWQAADEHLRPTRFRYTLPAGPELL